MRRDASGVMLDAKEKLATDQDRAQRRLDTRVIIAVCTRIAIERQDAIEISIVDRSAIRVTHQRGERLLRTGFLFSGGSGGSGGTRLMNEDAIAARRVAGAFVIE